MASRKLHILLRTIGGVIIGAFFFSTLVFAADSLSYTFSMIMSTGLGSSSSEVWFSTGGSTTGGGYFSGETTYYNAGNDTQVVGNYLSGYYYDSNYGYFQLNWHNGDGTQFKVSLERRLNNQELAARNKVGVYCYKFDGWAKGITTAMSNNNIGFIDFGYSNDIFVYYCDDDKKLHGYAYSDDIGFTSFEGIPFVIGTIPNTLNLTNTFSPKVDPFFANNSSVVVADIEPTSFNTIQGDKFSPEGGKESIFYIVK